MTLLDYIETTDLKIPLRDVTDKGSVYRSILYKIETIKHIDNIPTWKRIIISFLDNLKRKLMPDAIESVTEIPIHEDMYPIVAFLKEDCGYSLNHSLIIAASICPACLEYLNLELNGDTFAIHSMTKLADLNSTCPVCSLRKKAFYSRKKV